MFERIRIRDLDDIFLELKNRSSQGIFFFRINGYNGKIRLFIKKYYEAARAAGVVIEGRIPNPDEKNLSYYEETMGMNFQLSMGFLTSALKRWLPRMNEKQRNNVAEAIYDTLEGLKRSGKNENMLKNAYIKFMCWMYYRFERIMNLLGNEKLPKILYEGEVSQYELLMLRVLAGSGCDILLLQYKGDGSYGKLDPSSALSDSLRIPEMTEFPPNFSLKTIREEMQEELNRERMYGKMPQIVNCTNAWISGRGAEEVKTAFADRGNDPKLFYNCFIRINGVEDKLTYLHELYQLQLELKAAGRRLIITDGELPRPSPEEIGAIKRGNYLRKEEMITGLAANITAANAQLRQLFVKTFIDFILEEARDSELSLNKLTTKAVLLLCMFKKYQSELFGNWKMPEIGCFIHMGGCQNKEEALFLRFLARLPTDVLIFVPDLQQKCCLQDGLLYEIHHIDSLAVEQFPQENSQIHMATAAYHAERELDSVMYGETGLYRNQQYKKAVSITLKTMYEEIAILWAEEPKYRPGFDTINGTVNIPVIFSKVSGVKDGKVSAYWSRLQTLLTEETFLIKKAPYIAAEEANPVKYHVTEFLKNGKLQKDKIKAHQVYKYGMLREEIQEHILDKLQLLIDQKTIKGTLENGTEYKIIAVILNIPKEIVRRIQKFDFTKKNPKIIYVHATEKAVSMEDSILMAFLNLVGFDIAVFVPTGYQSIERHFAKNLMDVHEEGEYLYDLQIPQFKTASLHGRQTWREKLFRRGE